MSRVSPIERGADATISDGMDEDLKLLFVELVDNLFKLFRRIIQFAPRVGTIGIGFEHGRGVRLDDVVDVELHGGDAQPVIVVFLAGFVKLLKCLFSCAPPMKEGDLQPYGEIALLTKFRVGR